MRVQRIEVEARYSHTKGIVKDKHQDKRGRSRGSGDFHPQRKRRRVGPSCL